MSKQTSDCCYPDWNGSYITDKHKLDKDLFCIYCGWRPDYGLRQRIREQMGEFPEGSIKLVAVDESDEWIVDYDKLKEALAEVGIDINTIEIKGKIIHKPKQK